MEVLSSTISSGHINAIDYGYSFFKIAAKTAYVAKLQQIQGMAIAIRLAIGADKKTWNSFFKELETDGSSNS